MSSRIELLVAKHVSGAADVLVNTYALPPWNENWSLEAAAENVTYVLETRRSVALVAVDEGRVLGSALG
jgi:hypothetical protein